MRRRQGFEFNDWPHTPEFIRDVVVENLGNGFRWGRVLSPAGTVFREFLARCGADRVLDLCSGTGEPAGLLVHELLRHGGTPPRFLLSDLFPKVEAMQAVAARFPGIIEPVAEPVDAMDVPPELDCPARLMCSAFHHFPPDKARHILADAVAHRRALFLAEGFPRNFAMFAAAFPYLFMGYLGTPLVTRRQRGLKAVFTYLLPLAGAVGLWDGLVSCCRMYEEEELRALAREAGGEGYHWEYRDVPFFPFGRTTVFFGIPEEMDRKPRG